jgi:hypothetical protein
MKTGALNPHGQARTSWLMLKATAEVAADKLTLAQAPNWHIGHRLAITSARQDMNQAETVSIKAINGKLVTLDEKL